MLFTKNWETSAIIVDGWDKVAPFSYELLEDADPKYLRVDGDVIHISVANGWACYRITSRDDTRRIVEAVLVQGALDGQSD